MRSQILLLASALACTALLLAASFDAVVASGISAVDLVGGSLQ